MTASVEPLGVPSADDLDSLATLIDSLGYDVDAAQVAERLSRLTPAAGHATWVVRDPTGIITAVAGAHVMWAYNADSSTAQLLLLVVSPDARRGGVGSGLLAHFEEWAASHGAASLSAVSAAATDSAHRFYQKRGYHESGVRYVKLA